MYTPISHQIYMHHFNFKYRNQFITVKHVVDLYVICFFIFKAKVIFMLVSNINFVFGFELLIMNDMIILGEYQEICYNEASMGCGCDIITLLVGVWDSRKINDARLKRQMHANIWNVINSVIQLTSRV